MGVKNFQNLLHKELSYQIQGATIEVRKNFGPGHKESIYQNAFAEELRSRNIKFEKEKSIQIFSPKTGKLIGSYRPDFIVDDKIIIELKALEAIPKKLIDQLYDYLRNSKYELGYFINFSSPKLFIKRIIFTNDRKFSKLKELLVALSFILVAFSVYPTRIEAANFFVVPPVLATGEETTIILGINTEGQNINAVELNLKFSTEDFIIKNINNGNSIINFWVEKPNFSNEKGEVNFSGIIAGGYSSRDGELLKVNLIAKREGEKEFSIQNAKVLLSDGQGTEAKITANNPKFSVIGAVEPPKDIKPLAIEDNDSPESFLPQVAQDLNFFDGKYFLAFATQDKNSGIDRYEVKEMRAFEILGFKLGFAKWIRTESPYILKDQKLKSYIYVKAIDRAGNKKIETLLPQTPAIWYEKYLIWSILIIMVIIISYIRRILWRKIKKH